MSVDLKPLPASLLVEGGSSTVQAFSSLAMSGDRTPSCHRARFEAAFRDHFHALWRLAARLGVASAHIDDVVQEAFITAERRMPEISEGSERRFLFSVVVKSSANYRRRQNLRRERLAIFATQPAPITGADTELEQKQLRELLEVALDALPHDQRTVLVLSQLEELGIAEIAELLGVPQGTVASRLARARRQFSKLAARLRAEWFGLGQ